MNKETEDMTDDEKVTCQNVFYILLVHNVQNDRNNPICLDDNSKRRPTSPTYNLTPQSDVP